MEIRRARSEDAAGIATLYRQLVAGDDHVNVDPTRLAALAADPTNHLLVADSTDAITGTAFLTICLDPMYGFQPYGVIDNIVVLESARGEGIGAALLHEVEGIARAAHCTKLMLLSSSTRTEAHRFFESLGFDGHRKRGFVKYLNRTR